MTKVLLLLIPQPHDIVENVNMIFYFLLTTNCNVIICLCVCIYIYYLNCTNYNLDVLHDFIFLICYGLAEVNYSLSSLLGFCQFILLFSCNLCFMNYGTIALEYKLIPSLCPLI